MRKLRVPERTASPEELAEDRRRYLAAKPRPARCAHGSCQREATPDGRYCEGHAPQHATHGKNGRPALPAIADRVRDHLVGLFGGNGRS
jgi:hypothetical protein